MNKVSKPMKTPRRSSKKIQIPSPLTSMTDINDYCLLQVFEHLDINSLMKMSKVSKRFNEIITQHIIPLRTVNFSDASVCCSTQKIFQKFGPWMTRIVIDRKDMQTVAPKSTSIAELVRLIMLHCTAGKLQYLSLTGFSGFNQNELDLVNAAKPYFANVHTLCIDMAGLYHSLHLVNQLFTKENLHHLSLHNIRAVDDWLTIVALPNLKDVHICMQCDHTYHNTYYNSRNLNRLKAYIGSKPTLTKFDYYGPNHEEILHDLSTHIPGLTQLGTIRTRISHVDDNNNNQAQNERKMWKYLNEFAGLKEVSLQSSARNFANCGEIFRILAKRNTLEKLELLSVGTPLENSSDPIEEKDLRLLTKVIF